ncbi:hypothetical protein V3C99_005588 [Haemonchus contortus]
MFLYFLSIVLLADALPPGYIGNTLLARHPESQPYIRKCGDGCTEYKLFIVTDLDRASKAGDWTWRAVTRQGLMKLDIHRKPHVSIKWDSDRNLTSAMNVKGRAMELSDLTVFHNRVLTPDDRTGLISEIRDNQIIPWVFLNSGPGNTTDAFKCEWMTIKDGLLYVGSHGVEYKTKHGSHRNNMWVKTVTSKGEVTNENWIGIYNKMKASVGIPEEGYLTHEAVQWSARRGRWFFLPRKASNTPYNETVDEKRGTNLLISSTNLDNFDFKTVGKIVPERGYSAFAFIPDTNDDLIVALKSKEVGDSTATYITVFNIEGQVILQDEELSGDFKFEGLYFL